MCVLGLINARVRFLGCESTSGNVMFLDALVQSHPKTQLFFLFALSISYLVPCMLHTASVYQNPSIKNLSASAKMTISCLASSSSFNSVNEHIVLRIDASKWRNGVDDEKCVVESRSDGSNDG